MTGRWVLIQFSLARCTAEHQRRIEKGKSFFYCCADRVSFKIMFSPPQVHCTACVNWSFVLHLSEIWTEIDPSSFGIHRIVLHVIVKFLWQQVIKSAVFCNPKVTILWCFCSERRWLHRLLEHLKISMPLPVEPPQNTAEEVFWVRQGQRLPSIFFLALTVYNSLIE